MSRLSTKQRRARARGRGLVSKWGAIPFLGGPAVRFRLSVNDPALKGTAEIQAWMDQIVRLVEAELGHAQWGTG